MQYIMDIYARVTRLNTGTGYFTNDVKLNGLKKTVSILLIDHISTEIFKYYITKKSFKFQTVVFVYIKSLTLNI